MLRTDPGYLIAMRYLIPSERVGGQIQHSCLVWWQYDQQAWEYADAPLRKPLSDAHSGLRQPIKLKRTDSAPQLLAGLASELDATFERQAPQLASSLMSGMRKEMALTANEDLAFEGVEVRLEVFYGQDSPIRLKAIVADLEVVDHFGPAQDRDLVMAQAARFFDGKEPDQALGYPLDVEVGLAFSRLPAMAATMIKIGAVRSAALLAAVPEEWSQHA